MWVRSYSARESLRFRTTSGGTFGVMSSHGALGIGWGRRRGGLPMFSNPEYTRRRAIDTAILAASYRDVWGFPGVAALHVGPGRFWPYQRLIILHDVFPVAVFAVLPAWWLVGASKRPRGVACPGCGHLLAAVPGSCRECGAVVQPPPPPQPSAAGPVLRIAVVLAGLVVFFAWVWHFGGGRQGGMRTDEWDPAPARNWQGAPHGR